MAMINDTRGTLDAITAMQQNAQAALPVIPNNGNPQGANNMPSPGMLLAQSAGVPVPTEQPQQAQMPAPTGSAQWYPWMAPSPYMAAITQRLQSTQPAVAQPQVAPQQQQTEMRPELPQRTPFGTWTQTR